eukprot:SAG31_NODE_51_length_30464_cov_16.835628_16_plen_132_part_00
MQGISANQAGKVVETISSLLERLQKLHTQITAPSRLQQQLYYPNLSHSSANGTSEHEQVQRSFRDPGRVRPNFTRPKNATIFVDDAVRMAVSSPSRGLHIYTVVYIYWRSPWLLQVNSLHCNNHRSLMGQK